MNTLDNYVEQLLLFMSHEVEEKSLPLNTTTFDFNFEDTIQYINSDDKTFEGDSLVAFKQKSRIDDNKVMSQILMKALNEKYIKYRHQHLNRKAFEGLCLTDNGFRLAKAIRVNRKSKYKRAITYFSEKILIPFLVSIFTAVSIYFIMSYIKD